jgi:hypothetical protein
MKAVTANRLDDGASVYFVAPDAWTRVLAEATPLTEESANAALAWALTQSRVVVAPYAFALAASGVPDPRVKSRETRRMQGAPSFEPRRS